MSAKAVESWPISAEYGYLRIDLEVGDVFVYDDETAVMVTRLVPYYKDRPVDEEELERVKERRWRPWMAGGRRKPPKSLSTSDDLR